MTSIQSYSDPFEKINQMFVILVDIEYIFLRWIEILNRN